MRRILSLIVLLIFSTLICNAQNRDEHCRKLFQAAKNVYKTKGKQAAKSAFERVYNCNSEKVKAEAEQWWANQEKTTKNQVRKQQKQFKCLKTLKGHSDWVYSVAYSPDGTKIVSGSDDKTIKIWDANTGQCLKTLEGHSNRVFSVAYSPDGTKIISGSEDKTIKIWDANTGQCLQTLEVHSNWVSSVAYSPDGTKIISGSYDNTVKIWDANTGECLKTLEGHSDCVHSVSYSPDGKKIISVSDDGTIKIWGIE